jgi:hypothetical protein
MTIINLLLKFTMKLSNKFLPTSGFVSTTLFHSYIDRLRMNFESNNKSYLRTIKNKHRVRFNRLWLLVRGY